MAQRSIRNDVGTLRWDAATGTELTPIGDDVRLSRRRLVVSPDGETIVTAGDDPVLTLWDATTGQQRQTLEGRSRTVTSLAFNREESLLALGGYDGTITLWDAMRGIFTRSGTELISSAFDDTFMVWNLGVLRQRALLRGDTSSVRTIATSPDGTIVASAGDEGTIRLWEVAIGKERPC